MIAPESLQPAYWKRVPFAFCEAATETLWLLPGVHWKLCGDVSETPSTTIDNPGGFVVTVKDWVAVAKVAVATRGAFMDTRSAR